MQEIAFRMSNKQANMTFIIGLRTLWCRLTLSAAFLGLLPFGCGKPPLPPQPLVGHWQGVVASGNAVVPSVWEIRADGTQSQTLTLPQGTMTAQGTWTATSSSLTQRTTARIVILGGEQKTMPLANPMETTLLCQLHGDTLTLTQPDTHQQTMLTRVRETAQNQLR